MAAAPCADMEANCGTKHGPTSTLLRISNADIYKDVEKELV